MKKFERQRAIEKIVKGRSYVLISDIVQSLQSSESTIRRDIEEMKTKGLLIRSQGAVIWNDNQDQHKELIYYRQNQNIDAKKCLGAYAASMIESGDTLFIDTGTTLLEMARNLPDIPLTVVTNDLQVALALENNYNINTIILGGYVRRGTHTVIGSMALDNLENVHFQKAFFSPAGIDREGEFMFFNHHAMDVRKKAHASTEQTFMIADNSKFDKKGFVKGFGFSQCRMLITDSISEGWRQFLSSRIEIHTCQ